MQTPLVCVVCWAIPASKSWTDQCHLLQVRIPPRSDAQQRKREGRHIKYSADNSEGWSSVSFKARGGAEAPEDFTAQSSNEKSLTNPLTLFCFLSS